MSEEGAPDAALRGAEEAELAARRARQGHGDELVSPLADADERAIESALRPKRLTEFTGQARVREQLSLILQSALRRGRPPDHVLLAGPPGLGKTTIAMIVAAELGAPLRITSGPAIERSGDLAAVLSTLSEGEVIFIDEIHRLARPAEEMLYLAMEDFRVDVIIGKGPGATAIPLDIAPFTLVGATTRAGLLPAPLRDRFGFTAYLAFYQPDELEIIIRGSAGARSACPRWPSRWERRRRPWRWSRSRSWSAAGCWRGPRAAGWRPRRAGLTWASSLPRHWPNRRACSTRKARSRRGHDHCEK